MKSFLLLLLLLLLFSAFSSIVSSYKLDPLLPRPLILEYSDENLGDVLYSSEIEQEQLRLQCTSWRFAGEANNLGPWKTVPVNCAGYVRDYMTGKSYHSDLEMVAKETSAFARSVQLVGDGMDVWIFDVDETLLSNLPYYADHGFGLEVFDWHKFDNWVEKAMAPAIQSSLKLYEEILGLGFKIVLLTGRSEAHRSITVDNLERVGFRDWEKLILRGMNDHGKLATVYKSEKRTEMVTDGYRILGNSGDQWSDLLGSSVSLRSFKLPNPMYYIP